MSCLALSAPFAVVVIPGVLVLRAGLSAGYFGTIAAELLGRHEGFAMSVLAYFVPFLVITALPYVILVPLALGLLGFGSLGEGGAIVGAVFLLIPASSSGYPSSDRVTCWARSNRSMQCSTRRCRCSSPR